LNHQKKAVLKTFSNVRHIKINDKKIGGVHVTLVVAGGAGAGVGVGFLFVAGRVLVVGVVSVILM
jgi:hypothetical protein